MTALERIQERVTDIKEGRGKVQPGQPLVLSEAATTGDAIAQGDLYLVVRDEVPEGYKLVDNPSVQLVPGNTEGAKHCLASTDGVQVWYPEGFGPQYEGLDGPVLVLSRDTEIVHPVHGNVEIPVGSEGQRIIGCRYQREYDVELARERRAAD